MKKLFFKIMNIFKEAEIEEVLLGGTCSSLKVKLDGKMYNITVHETEQENV